MEQMADLFQKRIFYTRVISGVPAGRTGLQIAVQTEVNQVWLEQEVQLIHLEIKSLEKYVGRWKCHSLR